MAKRFTKLIRDKIPDLIPIESRARVSISNQPKQLAEKLLEEAAEVFEASQGNNRAQVVEELADLKEISLAIGRHFQITDAEVEQHRLKKLATRGGFVQSFTLDSAFRDNNTRWFDGHDFSLLHFLHHHIPQAIRIDLAVSFIMQSGLNLLENALLEALAKGCTIRILTTGYLDVTEPEALRRLLNLSTTLQMKMYDARGRSFHPKTWLFKLANGRELAVVGSSNLSRSALLTGVEWNYKVLDSDHGWPMQQAWQVFDEYFDSEDSKTVDSLLIDSYDARRKPREFVEHDVVPHISPNPVQKEAMVALQRLREAGERKAMVIAATGLGKTFLSAFDSIPFRRVLFVAHREELLIQAQNAFSKVRPSDRSQLLIRGEHLDLSAHLVFASIQTLAGERNQNLLPVSHFDYVVVDEFHRAAAKSYEALFDLEFSFLLGLTATPFRMDNRDLLALCDSNVAYQINLLDAISVGWLCPFHYRGIYDATDYSKVLFRNGRYSLTSLTKILNNSTRNALVLNEFRKSGSSHALGFCTSISHSQSMADYFNSNGVSSISLTSRSPRTERQKAINQLIEGDLKVIFTVDLFNEGVDIPCVDLVMLLRPTESVTVFLQQLGRGLRLHKDKKFLQVIDLVGNYRGADFKLPTLFGMSNWGQKEITDLANKLAKSNVFDVLPAGVQIDIDDKALEEIKALNKQGLNGLMLEEYARVKDLLGKRPSMIEFMAHSRYPVKMYQQKYRFWLDFLSDLGDLSAEEHALLEHSGDFLRELEKTAINKSYKPVVVLGMLTLNGFEQGASINELATEFRKHFLKSKYQVDLIGTRIFNIAEISQSELIKYLKENPLRFWSQPAKAFFKIIGDDRFTYTRELPVQLDLFHQWIREIAEYRVESYMTGKDPDHPDHKIVWGKGSDDKPHIQIDRKRSDLPADEQFHLVEINGEKYLARFVKIAINVIRDSNNDSSTNMLETILKQTFPGKDKAYLATRKVRITPIANNVGYEISFI